MSMRSHDHQLRTIINKKTLNNLYDKMNMVNNVDCIHFGYYVQQSNISNLVEYFQNDNDTGLSEMDYMMLDMLTSSMNKNRARSSWE